MATVPQFTFPDAEAVYTALKNDPAKLQHVEQIILDYSEISRPNDVTQLHFKSEAAFGRTRQYLARNFASDIAGPSVYEVLRAVADDMEKCDADDLLRRCGFTYEAPPSNE